VTLVCLEVPNKDRRFLERRDVDTCANSLGKIMKMTVLEKQPVEIIVEAADTPWSS